MKYSEDNHTLSLRDLPSWGTHRTHLDVKGLLGLIHQYERASRLAEDITKVKGKKRAAPSPADEAPRKRGRSGKEAMPASDSRSASEDRRTSPSADDIDSVPVYQHTSSLQYNTIVSDKPTHQSASEERATDLGWLREEEELRAWLKKMQDMNYQHRMIELGELRVVEAQGDGVFLHAGVPSSGQYLLKLPQAYRHINLEDQDIRLSTMKHELSACFALSRVGKVEMSCTLKLEILPSSVDADALPFRLHAEDRKSVV